MYCILQNGLKKYKSHFLALLSGAEIFYFIFWIVPVTSSVSVSTSWLYEGLIGCMAVLYLSWYLFDKLEERSS